MQDSSVEWKSLSSMLLQFSFLLLVQIDSLQKRDVSGELVFEGKKKRLHPIFIF
jgi:hypothetical protein